MTFLSGVVAFGLLANVWPLGVSAQSNNCSSVEDGYECSPRTSHHWGQYSPYFAIKSKIPDTLPDQCEITFAQILSRHGARFPTASKNPPYNATILQIQQQSQSFKGKYAFLKDYQYNFGSDNLTTFGEQELVDSGIKFYDRYQKLARKHVPFFRASGEDRVVQSALNFSQGYHATKMSDAGAKHTGGYPYPLLVIPEDDGSNNTLNADLCTAFEDGPESATGGTAQATWNAIWVPAVQTRLNQHLPGANLTLSQTIYMMDLCTFDTVASPSASISPFCGLFSHQEFLQYDYYQSLGKYYGYGSGNALGPTQGVGFTNELIARMLVQPVKDHTSVNHTLDDSYTTFPLGLPLYADFSHDNDLTGIFSAMGLYNTTAPLSNTTMASAREENGYTAAWTVPFAARAYFEKMSCEGVKEEYVRVIVNDRVIPLENCGADELGRCKLSKWVKSLSFARHGGFWDQCFT